MSPSEREIQDWIVDRVSRLTEVPPAGVDVRAPLARHGLDSVALIALASDLEKWLGYRFRENPLDAHPTIAALAHFLAGQVGQGAPDAKRKT
jgi:acyl carrier protein